MKWPRGKYNGQRIVGFRVTISIKVDRWFWWPYIGGYSGAFHWGPVFSWWTAEYREKTNA